MQRKLIAFRNLVIRFWNNIQKEVANKFSENTNHSTFATVINSYYIGLEPVDNDIPEMLRVLDKGTFLFPLLM
jgi:chemotaxis methyl-accepting protein methylase